eukprot:maker-scaffold339_size202159-snap-gene-1.25 protein:Tk01774 transcript:maker-scaffold339_size202159-snap-gene-1.25-mRNA-1 annotation:"hypothetical protein"
MFKTTGLEDPWANQSFFAESSVVFPPLGTSEWNGMCHIHSKAVHN